jgi:hypothetical protein
MPDEVAVDRADEKPARSRVSDANEGVSFRRHQRRRSDDFDEVSPQLHRRYRWLTLLAIWIALVVAVTSLYAFMQTQGVALTGDEPNYLVTALALTHFSPHVTWAYLQDFRTHAIYSWTPGGIPQGYAGPNGVVSGHNLGLPLLIFPFLAAGGRNAALVAFFAIEVAGLIFIHQRMSGLLSLSRRSRWVFALAIGAPALWLALTQLYPDLISGIFLACALVELAITEQTRRLTLTNVAVIAIAVGFTPWLHSKNFVPAALVLVAFVVIAMRRKLSIPVVAITVGLAALGWLLLLLYNQHYYGRLLGPQPETSSLTGQGTAQILALLFDRQQGLFVQVPTVVLGLVGLWFARRRVPIAALAALASSAAILILNGIYLAAPFGGTALAGRFEWSTLPMLLAWSPFVLKRIDLHKARTTALAIVISVLWVIQVVPIFDGEHYHFGSYYNASLSLPWDPSLYPGWWPGLNNLLPALFPPEAPEQSLQMLVGRTGLHILAVLGILVLGCALLLWMSRRTSLWPESFRSFPNNSKVGGVVVGACVVAVVLGVALPNRDLPGAPLQFSGADLGSSFVAGRQAVRGPQLVLATGDKGIYTGGFSYTLAGGTPSGTLWILQRPLGQTHPTAWTRVSTTRLMGGSHTVFATFAIPASVIGVQVGVDPGSTLIMHGFSLVKKSASAAS